MGRKRKSQLMEYRTVALLMQVRDYSYGRKKVQGIIDYQNRHCAWDIYRNAMGQPFVETPAELKGWDGDGIVGEAYDEKTIDLVKSLDVPFVNTASAGCTGPFPSVMLNNRLIGKMAARHLIERKLDRFAFVGPRNLWYVRERYEGFSEAVRQSGGECIPLFFDAVQKGSVHIPEDWLGREYLLDVMGDLPRPLGIMASNDRVGVAVLEVCRKLGIRSPEEISLIGVDNDNSISCQLANPSMTSVDVAAEEVGFIAARMLDDLLEGRELKESRVLVPPRRVVLRNSTDMTRSEYPEVVRALRFIRRHEHEFIDVSDVLAVVPVSRRWLELKFKEEVGWGIYQEIQRVHVERAKHLVKTTKWPMARIVQESGFRTVKHLDETFKKICGVTSQQYVKSRASHDKK
ncbi:substrate-binding domain-containing protein [Pontiellaceae bacterium B12227]|nr:substrate-binding domain-containing protein [Pontiellaceae bacterium B12227]